MKIGLDIGSTTIKVVVLDQTGNPIYRTYERHLSQIFLRASTLLANISEAFPNERGASLSISGSAGMGLAEILGVPFVQEVFATRVCADKFAKDTDVIIELGGEDAKILYLQGVTDARMNGSCAGGTGAFIDQMAMLLQLSPQEHNEKARAHEKVYPIASRCGVFAKTDVQPLLNQGARTEDVAASILYAVVNQTIAGLAQGRPITGNILYLGGPLTFLSELRAAFDHVLHTTGILPEQSLYFVSIGAALHDGAFLSFADMQRLLASERQAVFHHTEPLFQDQTAYDAFTQRHARATIQTRPFAGYCGRAHLGVDAGSTTVKTVLLSDDAEILYTTYLPNSGNPVPLVREALLTMFRTCPGMVLSSITTTGYGEQLCKEAFDADFSIVETTAHLSAAQHFQPNVDFIIDIGGQDMKCFRIADHSISDIFLNEACSSGCGSFLQAFAEALGQDIRDFAKLGLFADAPVELGSRCTVFMNSSVKQAQKDGASIENISAGLAMSVVKNALYKVIRTSNPRELGKNVVVQGGTFYNDAVLRAFEKEMGREVVRPTIAGLMGAFGAALYGRAHAQKDGSSACNIQSLRNFTHEVQTTHCTRCTNHCLLTINTFSGGRKFISGNRCERPLLRRNGNEHLNLYTYKQQLLADYRPLPGPRGKIGIPLGLNMYELLPFWHTLFTELGFEVVVSPCSTRKLYYSGQATIPSDTICYPAKLLHGHIRALCNMEGVNTIFYPCMSYNMDEKLGDNHFNCPVVAYYPEVIQASCSELADKTFIYDYVGLHRPEDFILRFYGILHKHFRGIRPDDVRRAARRAYNAYDLYLSRVRTKCEEIIFDARAQQRQIIVLAGRPYHADAEINHGIDKLIIAQGAAVISEDGLPYRNFRRKTRVLNQWTYHARLYAAAHYIANQPDMNLVQLVSFGCGLDAVTTDEIRDILSGYGKLYTQIKIDEIVNLGAVNIRLRSLFAALHEKSEAAPPNDKEAI